MTASPKTVPVVPPVTPGVGIYDAYASLLKGSQKGGADAETRPLAKGEFAYRISQLPAAQKAELQRSIAIFRELAAELPNAKSSIGESEAVTKAHTEAEVEKAAKTILVALRRDAVGQPLRESLTEQLFDARILSGNFEKAVALKPALKAIIGERLKGIYVLSLALRERVFKHAMLDEYFAKVPNSRDGLLRLLTSETPLTVNEQGALYHFGTLLPLYWLLANCTDISNGLCGNCSGTSEERIRLILGTAMSAIQPGLLGRLCEFASVYV